MLSKDDLKGYFDQMSSLESDMFSLYKKCFGMVADDKMKGTFSQLSESEAEHMSLVKRMAELLQK